MSSQPPNPTPLPVQVWGESDRGKVREINEDSFYCPTRQTQAKKPVVLNDRGYLLIVADGIGGSDIGQQASRQVVQSLRDIYYETPLAGTPDQRLAAAVQYANDTLFQMRARNPALGQAGSTVVAVVIYNNQLYLANAGDSRAYLIRRGQAFQRTKDHTLIEDKKARGLTLTEADEGVITRSMGERPAMPAELYVPTPLQEGDAVLLCSDGLSDVVDKDEIAKVIASNPPQLAAQKLIKLANHAGGPDNITAVVAKIGHAKAVRQPALSGFSAWGSRRKAILLGAFVIGVLIWAVVLLAATLTSVPTGRRTATPTAVANPIIVPSDTPLIGSVGTVTSSPTVKATSTLKPTRTPTSTPKPPTNTYTPTKTPTPLPTGTPTPTAEGSNGSNGGGGNHTPPPIPR